MGPPNEVTPSLRKTRKTSPGEPRTALFSEPRPRLFASSLAGDDPSIDLPLGCSFWLPLIWNDFAKQLFCFHGSQFDCLAAESGRSIILSGCTSLALHARDQIPLLFQSVQQRIKGSRAQSITVASELFDHPLAIQFSFDSMMKNMQANEAAEEIAMIHSGKMPWL